jgi:hypothetical protein
MLHPLGTILGSADRAIATLPDVPKNRSRTRLKVRTQHDFSFVWFLSQALEFTALGIERGV